MGAALMLVLGGLWVVLLVDEVDKSDPEFEAFLLEMLSDLELLEELTEVDSEELEDDTPTIKPSKHAAMCGQATADNHEERIRGLEAAVAYLLDL